MTKKKNGNCGKLSIEAGVAAGMKRRHEAGIADGISKVKYLLKEDTIALSKLGLPVETNPASKHQNGHRNCQAMDS